MLGTRSERSRASQPHLTELQIKSVLRTEALTQYIPRTQRNQARSLALLERKKDSLTIASSRRRGMSQ